MTTKRKTRRTPARRPEPAGSFGTAFHEAGHAVAALGLGIDIGRVWIRGEEGMVETPGYSLGRALHGTPLGLLSPMTRQALYGHERCRMVLDLAGLLAEALLEEANDNDDCKPFGEHDFAANFAEHAEFCRCIGQAADNPRRPVSTFLRRECIATPEALSALYARAGAPRRPGVNPETDIQGVLRHGLTIGHLTGADLFEEVERAEGRCARYLVRRWGAVDKLARSLFRRRSGSMTAPQVWRLLGADAEPDYELNVECVGEENILYPSTGGAG